MSCIDSTNKVDCNRLDSADYNALSIRRLERDTSVDRLSTGSKESNMSTQSDWIGGEKKKKSGLIGKCFT